MARVSRAPASVSFVSFPRKSGTTQKAADNTGSPVRAAGHSAVKKEQPSSKKAEALGARFAATNEDPQSVSRFLLLLVGLLLLASVALGSMLAVKAWRQLRAS